MTTMAKLYFNYSTMNAGKSTSLLQASHNYRERGMETFLITAQFDNRAGEGRIASRIGIGEAADTFGPDEDLFAKLEARFAKGPVACVFIDEAQFLSKAQVWQLARAVDDLGVPVMAYGLRHGPTRCVRCARSAIAARRPRWSCARGRMARPCAMAIRW
jgi:thymidine kinase